MKTKYYTVLPVLAGLIFLSAAYEAKGVTPENEAEIKFVSTVLGGCNDKSALRADDKPDKDTVIISTTTDGIQVFVGHNYICGAPFKTECEIKGDSIFMYIIDTCEKPFSCYNRCDCYYTFDFKFVRQGNKNYPYKIVLSDPRENEPLTVSEGIIKAPNDYYYWYKGEKQPLILLPTKKYISVVSPDDTLALKSRLTEQGIFVPEFRIMRSVTEKFDICWTIVEGENLPDLTGEESVLYEGGYFLSEETGRDVGGLDEECWVRVPQAENMPLIEDLLRENNITIAGNIFGCYVLSCTKQSKMNSMQIANLIYENGWCNLAEMGFVDYGSDAVLAISTPFASTSINLYKESETSENIIIEAKDDLINRMEVFDLNGNLLFKSAYSNVSRVNWNATQRGVYIFKIKLQSGNRVYRKMII